MVPVVAAPGPTTAQLAGINQQDDPSQYVDHSIRWYQSDLVESTDGLLVADPPLVGAYASLVIADGAVAFFQLDAPKTYSTATVDAWYTVYDDASPTREGQVNGQVVNQRPSLLTNDPGAAMGFDGSTTYVSVPNAAWVPTSTGDFSIEAWFRTTVSGTSQLIAANKASSLGTVPGWELVVSASGNVQITIRDGVGAPVFIASSHAYNDGLPHHAMAVRSGTTLTIYVDEERGSTTGLLIDVTNTAPFTIGAYASGVVTSFNGDIDEVAFYSTALSVEQFTNHDVIGSQAFAAMIQPEPDWIDLTARWFQPDTGAEFVVRVVPTAATVAQQAGIQQADWSEAASRVVTWFQPDTGAEWQPFIPARISQDVVEVLYADGNSLAMVSQDVVEILVQLGPQFDYLPVGDTSDATVQGSNYPTWYQPDTGAEFVPVVAAPSGPTTAQLAGLWIEQVEPKSTAQAWFAPDVADQVPTPAVTEDANQLKQTDSLDEQVSRVITWFQDEHLAWVAPANPSSVVVAQEPIQQPDPDEDLSRSVVWFQDETQSAWVPIPAITQATVAQEPIQNPDPSEDVDRTQRWFVEPDDTLGIPPFSPSTATVAQQAASLQAYEAVEQVDLGIRWYEEPDDQLGAVPIVITFATVAQQAGLWQEQPGQEASLALTWFVPESEWTAIPALTEATVAQEPVQVDGLDEQASRAVVWFVEDVEFSAPLASPGSEPSAAQVPIQQSSPDEERDRTLFWFQDEHAAWVSTAAPTVDPSPLKQTDDWSEVADRSIRWFAEEEAFWAPIPAETEASVAQEPIQTDDLNEQVARDVRWYQPEDDQLGVPPFAPSSATVAQQPIQQPSADEDVDRTARWFAEDAEQPSGIPPFAPSTATVAQQAGIQQPDWSESAANGQTWFQDETCQVIEVLSFVTVATVPQQAGLWIEQPIAWTDQFWFAPDASVEGLTPLANAPTAPDYGYDPTTDRDQTITWHAPDAEVEVLEPVQPTEAVVPQVDGWEEQADRTQRWYQEPDDALGIPPFAPSTATTAQEAALWPEQPYPERGTDVVWFAPEEAFYTPTPAVTEATVGQEPIQQPSADEEVGRAIVWFAPDEATWTPIPALTVDPSPVHQEPDWSEAASNAATWFAPDAEAFVPVVVTVVVTTFPAAFGDPADFVPTTQTWFAPDEAFDGQPVRVNAPTTPDYGWDAQADRDISIRWFAPDEAFDVPTTRASGPTAPDFGWDGLLDRDLSVRWFAEDASFDIPTTLAPAPTTPDYGWDGQLDRDLTLRWFAPDAEVVGLAPLAPAAVTIDNAYDAQTDRDLTIRWFAPDEAVWTPQPVSPTEAAIPQVDDWSEVAPNGQQWFQDEHDAFVGPSAPSTITVAQEAALWPEQPYPEGGNQARWFVPDDAYETPAPPSVVPVNPAVDTWQEQPYPEAGNAVTWYQPEDAWESPAPFAREPIPVAQEAALWQEQPYPEAGTQPRWFQPDDPFESPLPSPYFPPAVRQFPIQQPEATDEASRDARWFAPAESEWVPIPNLTQATVPQRLPAEQAYEALEQRDLSIRWYQIEDDYTGISPLTYNVTLAIVTATDAPNAIVTATDQTIIVTATDAPTTVVTAADAAGILVAASDGPAVIVTATDS